ncbi:MAG TPA: hypothetical protein VIP77_10705 [Jiangellaceae bacterium]
MRVIRTGIALAATAMFLTACSGDAVEVGGLAVGNSEAVLADADSAFDDLVKPGVDDGTTTVAEGSQCFFHREGDRGVADNVYCGPLRVLGASPDDAWYAVPVEPTASTSEKVSLGVVDAEPELTSISVDELFRPDGAEPVEVEALDEPQAPESPVSDVAVLAGVDSVQLDAGFEELDEPYRLVTPSAVITVEASADLEVIPAAVVSAVNSDSSYEEDAPSLYRPADGQKVRAWQVTVGSAPEIGPEADYYSDYRDASTSLAVGVGTQRLTIAGDLSYDTDTAAIACEQVQCPATDQAKYVLIVSAEGDDPASLIATVDGADQTLSLEDGALDSDVTAVAYSREKLAQQVSTTWETKTIAVQTQAQLEADQPDYCCAEDVNFTFGGEVQRVYLSPFDQSRGWAPAGKAWLVVPIGNDPRGDSTHHDFSIDWTKTWSLVVGDTVIPSEAQGEDVGAAVFVVDETFTEGTFTYSPAGSMQIADKTYPIATSDPLTLPITFP